MGCLEQLRQKKNRLDEPNEPTMEGPLYYVLQESPFASVFNSRQGLPLSGRSGSVCPCARSRAFFFTSTKGRTQRDRKELFDMSFVIFVLLMLLPAGLWCALSKLYSILTLRFSQLHSHP
jgi:hypothetical protein